MKHFLTVTFTALCLTSPAALQAAGKGKFKAGKAGGAEAMHPRRVLKLYDTNSNGVIDAGAEADALRLAFDAKPGLKHFDTNKDGKLDDAEIAAIKPHEGKGGKGKNGGKKKDAPTA